MGFLFTRLTRVDLDKLERLVEDLSEEVRTLRRQCKADRARVAKVERNHRVLVSLMEVTPGSSTPSGYEPDEVEDEEGSTDDMSRRLSIPMTRQ